MRDAFATVELIHPFLDCRKKFNPLGDFVQRNLVGQLANCIQDNFFLRHAVNMPGRQVKANWKRAAVASDKCRVTRRIDIGVGRERSPSVARYLINYRKANTQHRTPNIEPDDRTQPPGGTRSVTPFLPACGLNQEARKPGKEK